MLLCQLLHFQLGTSTTGQLTTANGTLQQWNNSSAFGAFHSSFTLCFQQQQRFFYFKRSLTHTRRRFGLVWSVGVVATTTRCASPLLRIPRRRLHSFCSFKNSLFVLNTPIFFFLLHFGCFDCQLFFVDIWNSFFHRYFSTNRKNEKSANVVGSRRRKYSFFIFKSCFYCALFFLISALYWQFYYYLR